MLGSDSGGEVKAVRGTWLAVASGSVFVLALAWVLLFHVPTGQFMIVPGVTENLNRIVTVQGGVRPHAGRLLMVAVSLENANLFQVLSAPLNPTEQIVPASELVPPGENLNQYMQMSYQQMSASHQDAQAAAFRMLGLPVRQVPKGVIVFAVMPGSPSARLLRPGDRIFRVGGTLVNTPLGLQKAVERLAPGKQVGFWIGRGQHRFQVRLKLAPRPKAPGHGFIGVQALGLSQYVFPRKVEIATSDIGGPSAGMMFSLEIVAQTRPASAFPGHQIVAGTGTISPNGDVGVIGGVEQKVVTAYDAGARLFLCPKGNYQAAEAIRRRLGLPIRIVAVSTLRQALADLHYRTAPRQRSA